MSTTKHTLGTARVQNITAGDDARSMSVRSRDAVIHADRVDFPGAKAPDRRRWVHSDGLRIAVSEWGAVDAPPILLAHGGFDFARTFDTFAPLLAEAGWRVVSWDQRCHGDSDLAELQSWRGDQRDATAVLDSTSVAPLPIIGHSKGGNLTLQLAEAMPHRFSHVVNIDGLPSKRAAPDVNDHERSRMLSTDIGGWLDHRRRAGTTQRKPGTLAELAERRAKMNPRLSKEWLTYLVTVGARHDPDGWRWKIDPMLRMGGFGPWRPEWALLGLPGLAVPFLTLLGLQAEAMGWGTVVEEVVGFLPPGGRLISFNDVGHFVHIEQPGVVADLVCEFLGAPESVDTGVNLAPISWVADFGASK